MLAETPTQEALADVPELRARLRTLQDELQQRQRDLARHERERRRLLSELGRAAGERAELAKLFVVAHRLHVGFGRSQVLLAIEEVVASILGCEQFTVYELQGALPTLRPIHTVGVDAATAAALPESSGVLKATLATGTLHAAGERAGFEDASISACVPLRADGRVTGLLVLLRLLDHKPRLGEIDREVLELLSHHAGSALYAASLYAQSTTAGQ